MIPLWQTLSQTDLGEGIQGAEGLAAGTHGFIVGGQTAAGLTASAARTNLAPQPPFFQLGLLGATVPGLKLEDPRLDRYMAAPPRRADAGEQPWVTVPVAAGTLLLFESWLRHEVPPNPVAAARVSVSFNYNWF